MIKVASTEKALAAAGDVDFKPGDQVRFRAETMLWSNHRHAIGTVVKVYALPANGVRIDVEWNAADAPGFGLPADLLSKVAADEKPA